MATVDESPRPGCSLQRPCWPAGNRWHTPRAIPDEPTSGCHRVRVVIPEHTSCATGSLGKQAHQDVLEPHLGVGQEMAASGCAPQDSNGRGITYELLDTGYHIQ